MRVSEQSELVTSWGRVSYTRADFYTVKVTELLRLYSVQIVVLFP